MDDIELKSEQLERAALESLHRSCPAEAREAAGLELIEVADAMVAVATDDQNILLNRTLGLGTREPVTADTIREVASVYAARGVGRYFIHIYPDTLGQDARELLDGPAFERKRGWMKFRSSPPIRREATTNLTVKKIGVDRSEDFGRIVAPAFGMGPLSVPILAGLANDERWNLFVSYDGDQPAGTGAMFIDNGLAWLEWGATDPAFRRRGSQGAIMAARLNLALDLGCEHAFTETGEAVDGDPQHSYSNILKAGFRESELRWNYAAVAS